ncbi:MAG TPA: hypothetical protein DDW93_09835, partial [Firmicutes bacterium]|nr:hypothetical protein [Bacillota bacterium]
MMRILKPICFVLLSLLLIMTLGGSVMAVGEVVLSVEVTGNQGVNDDRILRAITNIRLGEALN